jgi:hypothetical protein
MEDKMAAVRRTRSLLVIVAVAMLASCARPQGPPPQGGFIPFAQFLKSVNDAQFADYAKREGARVRDQAAFDEMRKHILTMYDNVKQVSSFTVDNNYFDCITIDTQPSVRLQRLPRIEAPPTGSTTNAYMAGKVPGDGKSAPSRLTEGQVDAFGNRVSCPDGTIPMARLTLEVLTRYETLRFFFSKDGNGKGELPPASRRDDRPEEGSVVHKYAHATQAVSNFGGNSWLNLWNPVVADQARMSLSQQWYAAGSGASTQTVEGGWQVAEKHWSTKNAVLFIYWTADKYDKTGCYNTECAGFVHINKNWYLGGPWTSYSQQGETQWGFGMQWKYFRGNWWLFLKGPGNYEAVGYYPGSIYGQGQMSRSAERIDYGGEVTGTTTWPQMGSGQFAKEGWQKAAFQNTIFYIPRDEDDGVGVWAILNKVENSPKCYTIDLVSAANGGNWGTYFFFGGPGGTVCE